MITLSHRNRPRAQPQFNLDPNQNDLVLVCSLMRCTRHCLVNLLAYVCLFMYMYLCVYDNIYKSCGV